MERKPLVWFLTPSNNGLHASEECRILFPGEEGDKRKRRMAVCRGLRIYSLDEMAIRLAQSQDDTQIRPDLVVVNTAIYPLDPAKARRCGEEENLIGGKNAPIMLASMRAMAALGRQGIRFFLYLEENTADRYEQALLAGLCRDCGGTVYLAKPVPKAFPARGERPPFIRHLLKQLRVPAAGK